MKVMIDVGLEDAWEQQLLQEINDKIAQMTPKDIETHAYLYDPEFINKLNGLMRGS
jgi:hypothetical protein